jgi:hypothetical protein
MCKGILTEPKKRQVRTEEEEEEEEEEEKPQIHW